MGYCQLGQRLCIQVRLCSMYYFEHLHNQSCQSVSQKQAGGFRSSDQAAALDNREHWGQSKGNIQAENTEITENTGVKGNVQASRSIIITKEAISVSKQLSADIVDIWLIL